MNDQPQIPQCVTVTGDPHPVTTRNKLLRVMRQVVEIKAGQRFIRSIPAEASLTRPPAKPASYFLGVDVATDIAHLAEELEGSVGELAEMLRASADDPAGPG